jgi:branched-chain amino acid transport system substrate-binding protein
MQDKLSLIATGALVSIACAAAAQDLVVRIAHAAPLSGAQAAFGKDSENGVRMALDDLNAKGIAIAGKKALFVLVAEDDAADPKQGTAVATRLCDGKVNGVVGHLNSGTAIPASTIYHQCGIPNITATASNPKLTQNGYRTTFRMYANDNALGAVLAQFAASSLGAKKVAIIDDRSAYGQGIAEAFKKTALARGMAVVDEHYTHDKATDFAAILTAIKATNPDAVFFGGSYPQAAPMLRQMEQQGLSKVKFLGGDGICSTGLAELAANAPLLANVVCATGGTAFEKMPAGAAWKQRYDAKFPNQYQLPSPYTYDATMVLVDAMVRAGSADPAVYAPQLFKTDYQGVAVKVAFDSSGELKDPGFTLFTYRDGQRVTIGE